MKICFFGDGESIHIQRWCLHFQKIGHEVSLISFKKVEIPHVTTYLVDAGKIHVDGGNWRVLLSFLKVRKIVKQIAPDVFHSLYATSYGLTGALCGFHPYVITALGSDILISPKQSAIYRLLLKFAGRRSDLFTVMSEHMRIESEKIGIAAEKIMVLPFGIDPAVFNADNRRLEASKFIMTSTRNFEDVYNIPHLLKSFQLVQEKIPQAHLNLIGAGSKKLVLEELVKELNLEEKVTFLGKISQKEMVEVFNSTHVFVSVSVSDGNNISLNEAMASGVFCIATNIPANTQWIEDGKNGFLVEIDDVETLAEKLIESHENYDSLQAVAIPINKVKIEEKGIWSNNMDTMVKNYQRLIQGK
ncbi:MAG: glycosyltransferase family 4 protein [Crocinitomicaceae bacterium]